MKRVALVAAALVALAVVVLSLSDTPIAFRILSPPRKAKSPRETPEKRLTFAPAPDQERAALGQRPAPGLRHRVCVQDPRGEAIRDLGLSFYCSDSSALRANLRTDKDGCTTVALCPGKDTVTCARLAAGRYHQARAWVLEPQHDASTLVASEARAIWGTIRDSNGQGVAEAKLWIEADDPDPLSPPLWVESVAHSDRQGRYRWQAVSPAPCDPCLVDPEDCEVSRGQLALNAPEPGRFWIRHEAFGLQEVKIPERWGEMPAIFLSAARAPIEVRVRGLASGQQATLLLEHVERRMDRQRQTIRAGQAVSFRGLGSGLYDLSIYVGDTRVSQRKGIPCGAGLEIELGKRD